MARLRVHSEQMYHSYCFLVTVTKYVTKSNLQEEGFIWSFPEGEFIMAGEAWNRGIWNTKPRGPTLNHRHEAEES